jgi:hypothetical protein
MFTYVTIFVASVVVALVGRFIYKTISDSSRSVYSSKERVAIIASSKDSKGKTADKTVSEQNSRVTPKNLAKTHPAMPTEHVDWGWQGNAGQVSEPATSHCSLYDANSDPEPTTRTRPNSGWPRREEKLEAGGRSYKVTRKEPRKHTNLETDAKPWGW